MSRLFALHHLFLVLFQPDELRMFLHLNMGEAGESLIWCLPGGSASAEVIAYHAVVALDQRGLIRKDLFVRLSRARPGRSADIDDVARQLLGPSRPKTARQIRRWSSSQMTRVTIQRRPRPVRRSSGEIVALRPRRRIWLPCHLRGPP